MAIFHKTDDFEPMGWIRGYPVYATTLLIASHVITFAISCFALAAGGRWWLEYFVFSSRAVVDGYMVWQVVTYPWVHLVTSSLDPINFLIEMGLLYVCGREVERFIGRSKFLLMYFVLIISAPAVLLILGFVFPSVLRESIGVHFGVFIAFATLYPSVQFWFNIAAKWLAAMLLTVYTLFFISDNNVPGLAALWVDSAAGWLFINWVRGSLPAWNFNLGGARAEQETADREPTPARSAATPRKREKAAPQDDPMAEIDPLLEKIAQHGMASLTAQERAKLQKARQELLKKH